ncbi:chromatin assembly factor 1 subunit A isoform X2 [Perca flavescens]|uniref:chromatin assembly factor 1 subunit A isoform X2 n=1 Tax=Perca flavescens TaxID=8167 RepID=UPI00106ED08C|nr:chromatin assembly factor 1 subunit A isoform X2 [Perca flavescens]
MLAAENHPSVDGHLAASTPRRRGMDRKSSKNANKKLIQARLPFKRLNPEPKENQLPKRPCAHACPESGVSDRENESSALPVHNGPPLVNGRGPLDGFLSRRRPVPSDKNMVIDLTEDNTSSPAKGIVSPTPASPCLLTKDKHQGKDKTASFGKSSNVDHTPKTDTSDCTVESEDEDEEEDGNQTASISQLDTTQDSESEPEEQDESENVSSLGNRSMLSASSVSSTSESSPEMPKTDDPTPTSTEPKTTPKIPSDQKQIKRRSLKSLQEQEERLLLQREKERQKEEAKAAKEKKKEEARRLKDEREREKREKKEKDEREKREKKEKEEKEKADRLKAKEELRKSKLEAKLEEKRKKEEEKQIKEEEKRLKEEKDRLKAEKAEITRFLQKPKIQQAPKTLAAACGKFAPFEIKEHMALAPLCRVQCEDSVLEELDRFLLNPGDNLNGLKDWISRGPRSSGPTKPRKTNSLSECITVEGPPDGVPDRKRYGSMKLLQFHANYRPAYWGTWSKKSLHISPRCPIRQDKDLFDYEVDSDEEWEEEEPGESLSHSEGEDEEEGGEDDDDDDGFFVPHGYLSDDEGALEEEEGGDLEKQKLRQKVKAREWDELMSTKKKMKVLDPMVRGCVWEGEGPGLQLFQPFALCLVEPLPKADTSPSPEELSRKSQREAQLLGQLLPLLHGNLNSSKVIITEFQEFCRQQTSSSSTAPELSSPQSPAENTPTRIQVKRLIKSNAVYEKRSTYRRCCWYVHTEVLSRFGQEALPVPCQWTYLTTGAREESREEPQAATGSQGNSPTTPQTSSTTSSSSNKRKSTGSMSITKFMKRCTDPEQMEATEADGFQADTEEDDEEDCVIIATQNIPTRKNSSSEGDCLMEVTPSDTAALPVACAAPTLATA